MPEQPPPPSAKRRAEVSAGRIAGAFGLQGELKLDATRIGADAVRPGLTAHAVWRDGTREGVTVAGVRLHQGRPLIVLAGVDGATAAQRFIGADILIARDDAGLAGDEYFDGDLIGCRLIDEAGVERGRVVDVLHYPAQDMLVIGAERVYLPLVRAFIAGVDVVRKEIVVTVPPGLLDPADAEEA